jgi:hypothetical protein
MTCAVQQIPSVTEPQPSGSGYYHAAVSLEVSSALPSSAGTVWSLEQRDEIHPRQQLGDAMRAYLDMPIELALKSENPFVRSLAIIDRPSRWSAKIKGVGDWHARASLVREFYRLRMQIFPIEESMRTLLKLNNGH